MKKNIIAIALLFVAPFLNAQSLTIQGKLANVKDSSVIVLIDGVTNKEVSTGKLIGGSFNLNSQLPYPNLHQKK